MKKIMSTSKKTNLTFLKSFFVFSCIGMCIFLILNCGNTNRAESGETRKVKNTIPPGWEKTQVDEEDKTLSPYFFVKSEDPEVDQLPLKSTTADVNIAGVIADVKVTQTYENKGENPIEAIYIFPGSSRAAVYGMTMTIGDRTIVANIEEKKKAREQYEKAKKEGKSASLLEQQRPNVFQMNVANIMPGDVIKVELSYTELLVPTDGVYEFVYPTVVGPRYSETPAKNAPPSEKWVENPYQHEGEEPFYTFDIIVNLSTGLPIQKVACISHDVDIKFEGKSFSTINLQDNEKTGGNKDYILKYQLAGNQVQSGLMLYEGEEENFFLLMAQPPERVEKEQIPPREYIFIMDVSGSMNGYPINISKKLLRDLIGNLDSKEKFNVMLFASSNTVMSQQGSIPATQENIQKAIDVIDNQRGGGGTRILPALKRALALPKEEGMSRTIVIVTDGYVSVEPDVFDLIQNNLGKANMFAFGIGSSVNRHLIEGIAHVGMGEPFVITKQAEAASKAEKFRKYIQSPVLTNIDLDFDDFEVYDVEPPSIPDVLAERPVITFGKWKEDRTGEVTLTGFAGKEKYKQSFDVRQTTPKEENSALRYLWARHRIKILGDYNKLRHDDERIEVITNLGLKYNLLTDYTSFVAIDSEVRNKEGDATTVKQPLPMPEGVSDYALGKKAGMRTKRRATPAPVKELSEKDTWSTDFDFEAPQPPPPPPTPQEEKEESEKIYVSYDTPPQPVNIIHPEYPQQAKDAGIEGTVLLEIVVGKDGKVKSATVTKSLQPGKGGCDEAAIEAAMKSVFKPAMRRGNSVSTKIVLPFKFSLDDEDKTKTIGDKTFHLINGIWTDQAHTSGTPIIEIKAHSPAYEQVLKEFPELKPYFELSDKIIINMGKYSIKISETGKEKLTEDDWKKLKQK